MLERTDQSLHVTYLDETTEVACTESLTFGRDESCDIVIDLDDVGVSRTHGRFYWQQGHWWVENQSKKRAFHVLEGGFGYPVFPAKPGQPSARPLLASKCTILIPGRWFTYPVHVTTPIEPGNTAAIPAVSDQRTTDFEANLTPAHHATLVAMAWGWLQPAEQYDPIPAGNDEIAARLRISARTVEKHVAELRDRTAFLTVLPDDPREARQPICEYYLANQYITHHQIAWLKQYVAQRRR